MSKKISVRDPQAQSELKVYVAVLAVLLVVRIPLVRQMLMQFPALLKHHRKLDAQTSSIEAPGGAADLWPKIYGRESSVSLKPTFIIPHEMPNLSERSTLGEPFERIDGLESYDNRLSVEIPPEDESDVQEAVPN